MKPIKPQLTDSSAIVRSISKIEIAGPLKKSIFKVESGQEVGSFCLLCPGKKCMTADDGLGLAVELCPAGAISLKKDATGIEISEACFGCGLCAIVCPAGAIRITEAGKAEVGINTSTLTVEIANQSQWEQWITKKLHITTFDQSDISKSADFLANQCMTLKGNYFYKTVESLLRLLGYDAKMSNLGDTSNRIDLIIRSDKGNVPVEIKSYTETPFINWKSIQQAVENKLLISRLDCDSEMTSLSSLVIGFGYPSERTGIETHIREIEEAFGIRVGIVSLSKLWELLLAKHFSENSLIKVELTEIRGLL
jgi:Fe-S-cluster-containing hydrogenase component 2